MKQILVLVPELSVIGGVANYYSAIKPFLPDTFVYFIRGGRGQSIKSLKAFLHFFDYFRFVFKLLLNPKIKEILINTSISKASLYRDSLFLIIAKKVFRKKIVVFFRGWEDEIIESVILNRPYWFLISFLESDKIIVLANHFKDQILSMGYNKPIIVETTTVNKEYFNNFNQPIQPDNGFYHILFMARVEENKGVFELLYAFEKLNTLYSDVALDIAGKGAALQSLKDYVKLKRIRNINFHDYVSGEKKIRLYQMASVLAFPSYHGEGMPNTVLESMAFGLPVITTKVGGLVDFFQNGKMGFWVEPKNSEQLFEKLKFLYLNKEEGRQIGEVNKKYAESHFMSDVVAKRLISHLNFSA